MATDQTSPQPLSQDDHVEARDFRIHSITLIDAAGNSRDITNLVAELEVRQDIYLGFMSGEILVTDGIDLHTQAQLHGGEYLFVHLSEPQQDKRIKKAFRVYKIGERRVIHNNVQRYTLYFMSDELFMSHTQKISKAYRNTVVSDAVKDILTNYLKVAPDKIKVDKTTDATDIIITYRRPAEAINWLASRAFNKNDTCFFFYENLDGFNFRSLQSLYKDKMAVKVPFTLETKIGNQNLTMNKFAIDSLIAKRDFDVLTTVSSGGYAMGLLGVDPIQQKYTVNKYNINEAEKMYENAAIGNAGNLFDKADSYFLTYLQTDATSTDKKNHSESWVRRVMALAALNNQLYELVVPGNMRLQVGKMINLRVPFAIVPNDGDMWDKRKGGKYLIMAVNHKFDLVNHKFDSILLVSRDSYPEPLSYDSKLPDKITKINEQAHKE